MVRNTCINNVIITVSSKNNSTTTSLLINFGLVFFIFLQRTFSGGFSYDAKRLDLRWPVKASEKKQELKSEIHFNLNATKFIMKSY